MSTITSVKRYLATAKEGYQSALTSNIASAATIVPIDDVTQYTNGDTVVLVIDPGNSSKQVFTGVVDTAASRITGVKWTEGSNVIHNSGAIIVDYVTSTHFDMLSTAMKPANSGFYRVNEYGAQGDGTTDDTTSIQAAIDAASTAGGGTVFFPKGKYLISAALSLKSFVSLEGVGDTFTDQTKGSVITQSSTTLNALYYSGTATGLTNMSIENLCIDGPASGSGHGIYIKTAGTAKPSINISLKKLTISGFGGYGVNLEQTIVSTLERITTISCTNGFRINGDGAGTSSYNSVNTSLTITACYADGCQTGNGFYISYSAYITLNSCAADSCGTAYLLEKCNNVTLNSCGAEWGNPDTASPADGFKITGGGNNTLNSPYTFQNKHYSYWITGTSQHNVIVAPSENSPVAATASYKSDAGAIASIINPGFTTARSEAGTTTFLDDGSGGMTIPTYLYSNGNLTAAALFTMFGGMLQHKTAVTTTYSVLASDNVILCDATASSFTATLPTAVGREGQTYTLKKTDSTTNNVNIATTSSQTIDGSTTQALGVQYEAITVMSDNANWHVI